MEFVSKDNLSFLWRQLRAIREQRENELRSINNRLGISYEALANFYIPPRCQAISQFTETNKYSQQLFEVINEFLGVTIANPQAGKNAFFIIADAGMGKSSFLGILHYFSWTNFWPSDYETVLLKLGPRTKEEIELVDDPSHCVLLLDSLDEDSTAWEDLETRAEELLALTAGFYKVILTCRTQFFPADIERDGFVSIRGCRAEATYLSPWNDAEVQAYITRRYKKSWRDRVAELPFVKSLFKKRDLTEREVATSLVSLIGDLSSRPLLLANLEDIVRSAIRAVKIENSNPVHHTVYSLYAWLVYGWLQRERAKMKKTFPDQEPPSIETLVNACLHLAVQMQRPGRDNHRCISSSELQILQEDRRELQALSGLQLVGRTLLNRDAEKNYRFCHYAIQEFLVIKALLNHPEVVAKIPDGERVVTTAQMVTFFRAGWNPFIQNAAHVHKRGRKNSENTLKGFLESSNVQVNLPAPSDNDYKLVIDEIFESAKLRLDFRNADLSGIILAGASLNKVDWTGVKLCGANLSSADLSQAMLRSTDLTRANLSKANFFMADLTQSLMKDTNMTSAHFSSANLQGSHIHASDCSQARFRQTNLREATLLASDFSGAEISGADLEKAKISACRFARARLSKTNFAAATLSSSDFESAVIEDLGVHVHEIPKIESCHEGKTFEQIRILVAKGEQVPKLKP